MDGLGSSCPLPLSPAEPSLPLSSPSAFIRNAVAELLRVILPCFGQSSLGPTSLSFDSFPSLDAKKGSMNYDRLLLVPLFFLPISKAISSLFLLSFLHFLQAMHQ